MAFMNEIGDRDYTEEEDDQADGFVDEIGRYKRDIKSLYKKI